MKRKPIAVIITDTHLSDVNHDTNTLVYLEAIRLAQSLGLKSVEHGGDLFHSRKAQTQRNLNCLGDIFKMFQDEDMELNIAVGNHDKTEYSIANSFLDSYVYHPNINIYRTGGSRPLSKNITMHYASYFTDDVYVENITNQINTLSKKDKNVLLTHIGVNGAVMNNGVAVETKVNQSLFDPYDLILIGHYHDAQIMSNKIKYIGAALQHNFGEQPVKGATILYDDLSTELHILHFPQFLSYEVSAKDLTLQDIEDLKTAIEENGDKLKIILTGTKAEIDSIDKQRLLTAGVIVSEKQEEIEREEIEKQVIAFTDTSLLKEFKPFCKKNKLDEAIGLKYLKQAIC